VEEFFQYFGKGALFIGSSIIIYLLSRIIASVIMSNKSSDHEVITANIEEIRGEIKRIDQEHQLTRSRIYDKDLLMDKGREFSEWMEKMDSKMEKGFRSLRDKVAEIKTELAVIEALSKKKQED
jgi:hypothetical protein